MSIPHYYKILKCIKSATTLHHIESCERMINNVKGCLAVGYLTDMVIIKKTELMEG